MASPAQLGRRRALLIAALPLSGAWAGEVLTLNPVDRSMLLALSEALGLHQPLVLQLAQRLRSNLDPVAIAAPLREAAQRMRTVIGPAIHTARATMPALIEDDFSAGRTIQVHGLLFSTSELALLLAVSSMPAALSG